MKSWFFDTFQCLHNAAKCSHKLFFVSFGEILPIFCKFFYILMLLHSPQWQYIPSLQNYKCEQSLTKLRRHHFKSSYRIMIAFSIKFHVLDYFFASFQRKKFTVITIPSKLFYWHKKRRRSQSYKFWYKVPSDLCQNRCKYFASSLL